MGTKRLFQLIDFDRTLFDTKRFSELIGEEINQIHPGLGSVLTEKVEHSYRSGETFFLLRYLRSQLGDDAFEAMVEKIVERVGVDALFMPGAKERLLLSDELTDARPSWGILTYGDEIDQRMKLRLVGLTDAPTVISTVEDKGELVTSWQNSDGTYTLPAEYGGQVVEAISLEDDKLRAFFSAPKGLVAICVNPAAPTEKQLTRAGYEIHSVKDLFESVELLRSLFLQ